MNTDHWDRKAKDYLIPHLQSAQNNVKIATGFFTVQGYDLIRSCLGGKSVQLMVGFDENSRERLKQMLIADIMRHLSQWKVENRRDAVLDLVDRIKKGRFQISEHKESDWIDAKARNRDHAKLYILDDSTTLIGSSNLTESGLIFNFEALGSIDEDERVKFWLDRFNKFWQADTTVDLTEELMNALLAWLDLRNPFDIYLKTILALIPQKEEESPRESYKMPVRYQMVVIERLLRQLKEFRGAMLVASTGLGKTIMATHTALRLSREKMIRNVVVFAPKQVHPDWEMVLFQAGLNNSVITRNLLDSTKSGVKTREMEKVIEWLDDMCLIIIDESQYFRNKQRATDGKKRMSFQRLMPAIKAKKSFVLLLTATPFSKEVNDLNNQLNLLPHTAEKKYIKPNGQTVMPGMIDEEISPQAWKVFELPDFFEKFMKLPVATVISTSQVAKNFAEHTDDGDYILFGEVKRWIPKVSITKIKVPVFMEDEISEIIDKNAFKHKVVSFPDRKKNWRRTQVNVENQAQLGWMSSPPALNDVMNKTVEGSYKAKFNLSIERRAELLQPLISKISKTDYKTDPKFKALIIYLKLFYGEKKKTIIFTERLQTAEYLERSILASIPNLNVASTVKDSAKGLELKDFETEVLPLIKRFAPRANADKISENEEKDWIDYDIFIATDAYSTGVNLQDASVVVNYDLAWTPDVLIQRAGRILRFWHSPRLVQFLIFVGDFRRNLTGRECTNRVEDRLRKLTQRSKEAQKFSEIPILSEEDKAEFQSLGELSSIDIEEIGLVDPAHLEEFTGVSPFLKHLTILKENEGYANTIPDDITSALTYPGSKELVYLLLRKNEEYFRLIYDIDTGDVENIKEDELLDLIHCKKDTPLAAADPAKIEVLAQKARSIWEGRDSSKEENSERICVLYLIPESKKAGFEELLFLN